ncbi:MAG: hypothetical protein PHH37_06480 [Paludibacter sp.]|nr:hypothetical protein [Paludibacter sp.]
MKNTFKYLVLLCCLILNFSCAKEYGPYEYAPTANFMETYISLKETDEAINFKLFMYNRIDKSQISVTISGDSVVETGSEGAVYGTDFTISPEPTEVDSNHLSWTLNELEDLDTVTFVLTPLHNPYSIENRKFLFTIESTEGNLKVGGQSSLKLTLNNVDESIEGYELSVSPKALNFTDTPIASGEVSQPKALTLTAKNLTEEITVVKTTNFKFSLSDDPETAKDILTIPLTSISNNNVTFYVFFAPTSSSSGTKTGQLLIQSYGVKDAKVALRGTQL